MTIVMTCDQSDEITRQSVLKLIKKFEQMIEETSNITEEMI